MRARNTILFTSLHHMITAAQAKFQPNWIVVVFEQSGADKKDRPIYIENNNTENMSKGLSLYDVIVMQRVLMD